RFPRETAGALLGMRDKGMSVQTVNDWLQAVRQFARWLSDNGRIERSPFTRLKPGNVRLDPRRRRGEFAPDEVGRRPPGAAATRTDFRGLAGRAGAVIYRVALGTGFRSDELAALVPAGFALDADPPTSSLPPEHTKNRQGACQPLPADLAAD